MSSTNGTVPVTEPQMPPETSQSPATPTLTESQWQALAQAAAAVQQAEAALQQARAQWQMVWAATGIVGNWTIDPVNRTLTPVGA